MISPGELEERVHAVEDRVRRACKEVGRERSSVTLVAVTKRHPADLVRMAWDLGLRDFGENYAQELRDKHSALAGCEGIRWHAIGPVQVSNAKYIAKAAHVFHALDRIEVARELSRRRQGGPLRCLIEVNTALEATKAGVTADDAQKLHEAAARLPGLEVVGLTAMPPWVEEEDAEKNRSHFRALRDLALGLGLSQLSMGTTSDFEVAIAEGATLVRVGTALFGERPRRPER